jgi:hypothetical protein
MSFSVGDLVETRGGYVGEVIGSCSECPKGECYSVRLDLSQTAGVPLGTEVQWYKREELRVLAPTLRRESSDEDDFCVSHRPWNAKGCPTCAYLAELSSM